VGELRHTADVWRPYQLIDPSGMVVDAVHVYFADLLAAEKSTATLRSYGMDLLRWFRFLWAVRVAWNQATRVEARDFSRWLQLVDKPSRARRPPVAVTAATSNPGTGKPTPGPRYALSVRAHSETVLRTFYDFHQELGTGPVLNPFPIGRRPGQERPNAGHNPMGPWSPTRTGRYRPTVPKRIPRCIPDGLFDELFAALPSHRDRALVAFAVSTGARAAELLGLRQGDADPGQQLITVIRKGTRAVQQLPASPDAFVWLRLYQQQMHGLVPGGRAQPLWRTLRRPYQPLTYHAALAVLRRAQSALGSRVTWHDFRHTAAYRMARDPQMPLTDVQWVLAHADLSTTQLYLTPHTEEVIASVRAHHARRTEPAHRRQPPPAPGYRPETLHVLFGSGS
jgi:site-specific recombinase XerD